MTQSDTTSRGTVPDWVVGLIVALLVAGGIYYGWNHFFSDSAEAQIEDYVGADCVKAGLMVVVGERETVYTCGGEGDASLGCFAVVDGEVLDVTSEARALTEGQRSSFDC